MLKLTRGWLKLGAARPVLFSISTTVHANTYKPTPTHYTLVYKKIDPQSKRQPLFQNDAYRVVIFCFFGPLVVRIHTISIHHCLATSKHNSCIIYLSIINKAWHPILLLKESLPGFISWRYCEANIHLCSHKTLHTHHCLSWKIICLWASQELQPQILAKSPKRCQKSARPFIPPQCFHLIWKGRLLTSNMSIYLSFLPSTLSCLKSNSLYIAKNNLPNP